MIEVEHGIEGERVHSLSFMSPCRVDAKVDHMTIAVRSINHGRRAGEFIATGEQAASFVLFDDLSCKCCLHLTRKVGPRIQPYDADDAYTGVNPRQPIHATPYAPRGIGSEHTVGRTSRCL